MAELVYTRVSTDEQSTTRQTHLLAAAGLTAPDDPDGALNTGAHRVRLSSDPTTSSKIPALERAGFRDLADYARPGDRLTVSELYRLCRDLADILAVRDWCRRHNVALRELSGALSGIVDLAATDATTTMLVNVLVSVGQFQRDLQNELTREGLAAARAGGAISGRRPRVAELGVVDDVRQGFRDGASIAALARDHHVSRVAVRTAIADLLPGKTEHPGHDTDDADPRAGGQAPVRIEIPGTLARRLHDLDELGALGKPERRALRAGRTVRHGQGYSLQITAAPQTHHALLHALTDPDRGDAQYTGPAERKAYRIYRDRVRGKRQHDETPQRRSPPATSER